MDAELEQQQEMYRQNMADNTDDPRMFERVNYDSDLTRWQQDLSPLTDKMIHRLKNEILNANNDYVPIPDTFPLCSDECVYKLVALLESIGNQNTIMCKMMDSEIKKNIVAYEHTVILDILLPERKKYNTSLHNLSQVKKIFRSFITPTYFRAIGGFEATNLRTTSQRKELITPTDGNNNQKDKSRFKLGW